MWDERYNAKEYAYGKLPNDFLVEQYHKMPRGRVLCVAEGEGRNAVFLAEHGYDVVAVDASAVGMQKAKRLAEEKNVCIETIVADLKDFVIEPESFDAVVSIFCHLPIDVRKSLHQKVVSGLRSGGVFILEAYTPEQLKYKTGGPQVVELTMKLPDVVQEISGLEIIYANECEREVCEGIYHTGPGAVAQLVAIKK